MILGLDPEFIKSSHKTTESSLALAKSFWQSTEGLPQEDVKVVLAPHAVRFAQCCSLAINKYCVVIGIGEASKPRNEYAHEILGMADHPFWHRTFKLIRELLKKLQCTFTFTFHIEGIFGPDLKPSIPTILAGVWKFAALFQPTLLDNPEVAENSINAVIQQNELQITSSEISAALYGSKKYAYLNGYHDGTVDIISEQTELVRANIENMAQNFSIVFLRTNLSEGRKPSDNYFANDDIEKLVSAFKEIPPFDPLRCLHTMKYTSFRKISKEISRARTWRTGFKKLGGTVYERFYERMLDGWTSAQFDGFVHGGFVVPAGFVLWMQKDALEIPQFHNCLAMGFVETDNTRLKHMYLESYEQGDAPHAVDISEHPPIETTTTTVELNMINRMKERRMMKRERARALAQIQKNEDDIYGD